MKNKLAFALAGLLAVSTAAFAAGERDHGGNYHAGDRGGHYAGAYHETYRGGAPAYGYRGGGGVYLGVTPGYYSGYIAPTPYVDPYAYAAPAPYADPYAAPYPDEYVGAPPFPGAIWIGGNWGFGPHGRYWVRGHWGRR